ncbi:hypothetical protein [Halostagnicola kamekurae]|uniref:Uncharacterized protein n=1 Tax=Halostagnicola kamekurae TaxID=619731 RepID=A0A1I6TEB1_9EURY|nr:hypothetical protein [Halostagnicola kamekurae]SFS87520.1 hypothetical protein SAMN04488556_3044 [Halostagnicola kamekurae]
MRGTDEDGTVFSDKSYEANQLRSRDAPTEWVQDWEWPYYIRTESIDDE